MNPLYFNHLGLIEAANRKPGPSKTAHEKGAVSPQAHRGDTSIEPK
jgi:hypothetical protein